MIGIEIKKVLRNRNTKMIMLVGILLSVCQGIYYRFFYYPGLMGKYIHAAQGGTYQDYIQPPVILQGWLGMDFTSVWHHFFYLMLPLLAVVPWADSYYVEKKNGYLKLVYTKAARVKYVFSKYMVVFVIGALVVAIPLILSFYFSALYLPMEPVDAVMFQSGITNLSLWGDDFYQTPCIYALKYTILDAVYGGLFAVLSFFLSFFMKSRFTIWTFLFLLNLVGYYILYMYIPNMYKYIPYFFMNANAAPSISKTFLVMVFLITIIITLAGSIMMSLRDEIF